MKRPLLLLVAAAALACQKPAPPAPVYQAVPVERRDIVVSARANGTIQPDTTVEVKSKASGEILQIRAETGQVVKRGDLLVSVDPRQPRNTLAQAQADLEVAQAQLTNATAQKKRSDELFQSQSITQQENEQALLDYANAKANVVKTQVSVENARIQLEDAEVRAPITGTIIEKDVERGTVISSATSNVSGGTVLLKMADLNLVQVSTLVDETDIGKIQPGLVATVTVQAYPNRPFDGSVVKIEPQAVTQQNVTMFPVEVRIANREGLLRPGMNADVEIHVGRRDSVLAIPNAALRTQKDVASAAQVLGLSPSEVQAQLAAAQPATDSARGSAPPTDAAAKPVSSTSSVTLPDGRSVPLPDGVSEKAIKDIMAKRAAGQELSAAERVLLRKVFQGMGGGSGGSGRPGGGGGRENAGPDTRFGGRYIVFVQREGKPVAVNIRTGLTDLDYSEVLSGLTPSDSVLVLPSASLIASQQEFKERMGRITGGGGLPGLQQQPPSTSKAPTTPTRP